MPNDEDSAERVQRLLGEAFADYSQRRLEYYRRPERLLAQVLKKDALIFALRGAQTADQFIEAALGAHESSSEETMMGNAWQAAIASTSPQTVGGGDLRTERDGVHWIIQVKSSEEQNSAAEAQDLRILRTKLLAERDHHPRRRSVRAMLGIVRGTSRDADRIYRAGSPANADIDGFQYRYLVGAPFRQWCSAELDPHVLISRLGPEIQAMREARQDCLLAVQAEFARVLDAAQLGHDIASVLLYLALLDEARSALRRKP